MSGKNNGGRRKAGIPGDFAANAHRRNDELAKLYDVSYSVIQKWRKATGLKGTKGRGPAKGKSDTQAQIDRCLTCRQESCPGHCPKCRTA